MAFLEIAAAAFGKGIADELRRRWKKRSLVQLPPDSGGDSQPTSERRLIAHPQSGVVKKIGYSRR